MRPLWTSRISSSYLHAFRPSSPGTCSSRERRNSGSVSRARRVSRLLRNRRESSCACRRREPRSEPGTPGRRAHPPGRSSGRGCGSTRSRRFRTRSFFEASRSPKPSRSACSAGAPKATTKSSDLLRGSSPSRHPLGPQERKSDLQPCGNAAGVLLLHGSEKSAQRALVPNRGGEERSAGARPDRGPRAPARGPGLSVPGPGRSQLVDALLVVPDAGFAASRPGAPFPPAPPAVPEFARGGAR